MSLIENINFFVGSGASVAFGYPSMTQLTSQFRDHLFDVAYAGRPSLREINKHQPIIDVDSNTRSIEIYDKIYKTLNQFYPGKVDIESIMSVVTSLKEKNLLENIGDFGLYQIGKISNFYGLVNDNYSFDALDQLENRFKQYVREKMGLDKQKGVLIDKIYDNLFGALSSVLEKSISNLEVVPYSELRSSMHTRFNIFTTNYDTAIERYFRRKLNYNELDTGAIDNDRYIDMDRFIRRYYIDSGITRMKLMKLHGLINWFMDNEGKIIQGGLTDNIDKVMDEYPSDSIKEEVIIYPLNQKHLYLTPFIQMFYHFQNELGKKKVWIIIGYSFRDAVIRHLFENHIDNVKGLLLIDPNCDTIINSFSDKTRKKIISIQKKFGEDNYEEVNKEIAKNLELFKSK